MGNFHDINDNKVDIFSLIDIFNLKESLKFTDSTINSSLKEFNHLKLFCPDCKIEFHIKSNSDYVLSCKFCKKEVLIVESIS